MIKADPGYRAVFNNHDKPIIAWDDNGDPMVLGPSHKLVSARSLIGFTSVAHDEGAGPIVGVVPGQGWTLNTKHEDGAVTTVPVVAFLVREDGFADFLTACGDGLIMVNDQVDGDKFLLTPPGGWPGGDDV